MLPADAPFLPAEAERGYDELMGAVQPFLRQNAPSLTEPAEPVPSDSFWLWPSSSRAQLPELPGEPEKEAETEKKVLKESRPGTSSQASHARPERSQRQKASHQP